MSEVLKNEVRGIMYEIGSEFNFEKASRRQDLVALLSETAQNNDRYAEFLRCGRDAIGFVADDIIAKNKETGAIIKFTDIINQKVVIFKL